MESPGINATLVSLYHICHRELWLHARGIRMEYTSELVGEGRLIAETSYPDRAGRYRELVLGPVKLDHYDPQAKLIREVKKSAKVEGAHIAQVKYYLFLLEEYGLGPHTGLLEYPRLRQTESVTLQAGDHARIRGWLADIRRILALETPPARLERKICRSCSYFDFCYAE